MALSGRAITAEFKQQTHTTFYRIHLTTMDLVGQLGGIGRMGSPYTGSARSNRS